MIMTIYSTVTIIGIGVMAVGGSSVCGYIAGKEYLTRWIGDVPMAFSTSILFTFVGLALYLIGKKHLNNEADRQV